MCVEGRVRGLNQSTRLFNLLRTDEHGTKMAASSMVVEGKIKFRDGKKVILLFLDIVYS